MFQGQLNHLRTFYGTLWGILCIRLLYQRSRILLYQSQILYHLLSPSHHRHWSNHLLRYKLLQRYSWYFRTQIHQTIHNLLLYILLLSLMLHKNHPMSRSFHLKGLHLLLQIHLYELQESNHRLLSPTYPADDSIYRWMPESAVSRLPCPSLLRIFDSSACTEPSHWLEQSDRCLRKQ